MGIVAGSWAGFRADFALMVVPEASIEVEEGVHRGSWMWAWESHDKDANDGDAVACDGGGSGWVR